MDYRMLITYIIVDIFCIIIVGVLYQTISSDSGSELEIKSVKRSLWSYILFMITGLIGLITENVNLLYSKPLDYICNILSLSFLALSGFFWFIYVQLRVNKKFIATKWRIMTYIPILLVLLICISSPFTKLAFFINEENTYVRGPLFLLISTIPLLYDFASSITAYYRGFHEPLSFKRKQYFNLGAFIFFPLVASILQILLAGMPILAPAIAASYYIVFISTQQNMIYNDSLTGLNNRRRAMSYIDEKISDISENNPLTVFMIDGNKFKLINDTYGHLEGDSAIICIGEAVSAVCSKYKVFCARYGGDEFILVKFGECNFNKDNIDKEINDLLADICNKKNKKYTLSVTSGFYTSIDNTEPSSAIIKKSDENLYYKKKK